jgi:hypothetical protein
VRLLAEEKVKSRVSYSDLPTRVADKRSYLSEKNGAPASGPGTNKGMGVRQIRIDGCADVVDAISEGA